MPFQFAKDMILKTALQKLHDIDNNSFTRQELTALGISWPPKKGWRSKLLKQAKEIKDTNKA